LGAVQDGVLHLPAFEFVAAPLAASGARDRLGLVGQLLACHRQHAVDLEVGDLGRLARVDGVVRARADAAQAGVVVRSVQCCGRLIHPHRLAPPLAGEILSSVLAHFDAGERRDKPNRLAVGQLGRGHRHSGGAHWSEAVILQAERIRSGEEAVMTVFVAADQPPHLHLQRAVSAHKRAMPATV